jgi:hypothetical protein
VRWFVARVTRERVVYVAGTMLSAACAWALYQAPQGERDRGTAPAPAMIVLVDHPGVSVQYTVSYFASVRSVRSGAYSFGPPASRVPIGVREIELDFRAPEGVDHLTYDVLFDEDAAMVLDSIRAEEGHARAYQFVGSSVTTECRSVKSFATAQEILGRAPVDRNGVAQSVKFIGQIPRSIRYPENGERTPVSVLDVLPPAGEGTGMGRRDGACAVGLSGPPVTSHRRWLTPRITAGEINVGPKPPADLVESANPPLRDPLRLEWLLRGPASVSYTLVDTNRQAEHERYVFIAGVIAALAAAFLAELIKNLTTTTTSGGNLPSDTAVAADLGDGPPQREQDVSQALGQEPDPPQQPGELADQDSDPAPSHVADDGSATRCPPRTANPRPCEIAKDNRHNRAALAAVGLAGATLLATRALRRAFRHWR